MTHPHPLPALLPEDTLRVGLVYGLVGLVDVLHGDGVGELVEHPLLEGLQPLVVVAAAHKLLVLQSGAEERRGGGGSEWERRKQHRVILASGGGGAQLQPQEGRAVTSPPALNQSG